MSLATDTEPSPFPGLGTLSKLPREIREDIYNFVLYINVCESYGFPPPTSGYPRTAILKVSKQIYKEAGVVLYMFNEFQIIVTQSHHLRHVFNTVRQRYFKVDFFHAIVNLDIIESRDIRLPMHMRKYVRNWTLNIGPDTGISGRDIMPTKVQWATYKYLLDALEEACRHLSQCQQTHELRVKIRVAEAKPFGTELILAPISKLRNIRTTYFDISSTDEISWDRRWPAWRLKHSYARYMSRIMALPKGVEAEGYNDKDEDEGEKKTKGLFQYIENDLSEDDSSTYSSDTVRRTLTSTWITAMNEIRETYSSSEALSDAASVHMAGNTIN